MHFITENMCLKEYYGEILVPYLRSLSKFMVERGYTGRPLPKVHFIMKDGLSEDPFAPTANYDPDRKIVNLYIKGRAIKDILRSFAHELIHHQQNIEGRLSNGAYSGTEITEDRKLQKLEAEAYLKGNMIFRSWTEIEKKK